MPIKISQIETDSLGPISTLKADLADVTLIYGHNEKGKTFLVELILQSLFKNLSGFKDEFRVKKLKGTVTISGLEEKQVLFSPSSKNKLDSIREEQGLGMPPNIARLLVVKGGDTEIDKNTDSGISHNVLREFLSGQGILDSIQKNIRLKSTKDARTGPKGRWTRKEPAPLAIFPNGAASPRPDCPSGAAVRPHCARPSPAGSLPSRLIAHRHRPRAELQPADELQVDIVG